MRLRIGGQFRRRGNSRRREGGGGSCTNALVVGRHTGQRQQQKFPGLLSRESAQEQHRDVQDQGLILRKRRTHFQCTRAK